MKNYDEWLDDFNGIKPHRSKHDGSFNNILFSAELLVAKAELKNITYSDMSLFIDHAKQLETENGGYAPKDSHDNILGKIVGLETVISQADYVQAAKAAQLSWNMKPKALTTKKHPRDIILFRFFMDRPWWSWVLLPLALLDIMRAIADKGKVRPKFWKREYFMFRLKAYFGLIKPYRREEIFGGYKDYYAGQVVDGIRYMQNDGKILNLLRLNMLREFTILKPFVRLCKRMYIKRMGKNFQSQLMANYFEEPDHPVRVAFNELDAKGLTVIDC